MTHQQILALLQLVADLYAQVASAQMEVAELRQALSERTKEGTSHEA